VQNLTVQKVCLFLITLAVFIAAPWLTSETLQGNSLPLISLAGVALTLLFVYGLGDRCWLIIPFCLSVEGNLNFLPLNFSIQELAILTVLAYLLFRMIFGLNVGWKLGPSLLWVPLSAVLGLLCYHWIGSGDIGIKVLGGTGWGGRRYFKVALAALSVPLLASMPNVRKEDLNKVPLIYFLGSLIDILPDVLTTFVPAAAPIVWKVYSGVNLTEYGEALQGNFGGEGQIARVGSLSKIGTAMMLVTLCYFPAYTWLNPNRIWALPLVLAGGALCALSGFRSSVFKYFFALLAGLYATLRWRAFLILPVGIAAAVGIALTQGKVFEYPLALQRGLAFIPGDWDIKAKSSADGSTEWRGKMKDLFFKEYFQAHPIVGKGYHFDPNLAKTETDIYLAIVQRQAEVGDEFAEVRRFIEMRQPHEGPIHILLVIGTAGMVFFSAYCVALLIYSFQSVMRTAPRGVTPIQIWAVALLLPQVAGFFLVFGDLTTFLIQVCPVITLLYRFEKLRTSDTAVPAPAAEEANVPSDSPPFWNGTQPSWHRQPPS